MALGVVGAVDEEASDGGGESAAAYGSGLFDVGGGEGADALEGGVDAVVELFEEGGFGGVRMELSAEGFKLGGAELVAFGVGEEAIEAADDVAEVKGDGGEVGGTGVEGGVGERRRRRRCPHGRAQERGQRRGGRREDRCGCCVARVLVGAWLLSFAEMAGRLRRMLESGCDLDQGRDEGWKRCSHPNCLEGALRVPCYREGARGQNEEKQDGAVQGPVEGRERLSC